MTESLATTMKVASLVYLIGVCVMGAFTYTAVRHGWDRPLVALGKFIAFVVQGAGLVSIPIVWEYREVLRHEPA